jgi:methyl-accepting chemotaxis protein
MQKVSERDYDVALAEQERGDEIGSLSRALMLFRDKLSASDAADEERKLQQAEQARVVKRLSTALSQLADGDLTRTINTPFVDDYDMLRQDYNRTIANLNETIGSVVLRAGGDQATR